MQALDVKVALFGDMHKHVIHTYTVLSVAHQQKKDHIKAIEFSARALEVTMATCDDETSPELQEAHKNLGGHLSVPNVWIVRCVKCVLRYVELLNVL
eukprot:m.1039615 g.1039615  ORF g.1039615 m.1039615 type:complete len:97 (+) comp24149_c2_seq1:3678-3968(+)